MAKKKKDVAIITIRFAGVTQLDILESTNKLANNLDVIHSELLRNLIAIGLAAYNSGAVIGFDGKVILPYIPSVNTELPTSVAINQQKDGDEPSKKSLFID